jgi:acyl-CoA synthetase (AMP-forming)/AMP-acid ligase II
MSLITSVVEPAHRADLALADGRIEYSWAELDPIFNRAINALLQMGDRARVAVCAHNSAEAAIAYGASVLAGVQSTPVSFHLKPSEIAYILADSGATILFVGPETAEAGLEAARAAGVGHVVGWRCDERSGLVHWEQWIEAASADEPPIDKRPTGHLHYTSGTTGKPKGTMTPPSQFPQVATMAEAVAIMHARLLPTPGLVVGPNYHTGPLTTIRCLVAGGSIVMLEHFDAEGILAAIDRYKIRGIVMVPTHFQRLLALPDDVRTRYDVSSIERIGHTGAACPPAVKRAMIEWFGPVLVEAYGGTESGVLTAISSVDWLRKPGSVGKAVPPFETLVVDEAGRPLEAGQAGRLFFRDTTGHGIVYHNDPAKTAAAHIAPGIFTLGEMGYVDEEGYVFITDRESDMIVSGGVNIYPAEAEHVLLTHPDISDIAIVGVPNADMGEEAKALVIPVDWSNPPAAEELDRFARAALASYKCPRSYEFVEDIGRNAMGKVNKRALRQRYWPTDRTIGG